MKPSQQKIIDRFLLVAGIKLSRNTRDSYLSWIRKYVIFLDGDIARAIAESEKKAEYFLSQMERHDYSRGSQSGAFYAILFLYKRVFEKPLKEVDALRCRKKSRERYTPTPEEVMALLHEMRNTESYPLRLVVALMYGCGLRVSEVCQLRIKDFDLSRMVLTVYEGKGDKDRQVSLPDSLLPALRKYLAKAGALAEIDIAASQPVQLPGRLDVKYPKWQFQARWHFVFPSPKVCEHPRTKKRVRWCMGPEIIQRGVKAAAERAKVEGKVTPHCLRHAFCSHLLDHGMNIKRVAEAMGHTAIRTTAGYGRKECLGMKSPLEILPRNVVEMPSRKTA
jgi:site-specific recombinase XerD